MQCTLPCLVRRRHCLQVLVLLTVLLLILRERAAGQARRRGKSTKSVYSYRFSCKTCTSVQQIVKSLDARVATLETISAFASSGSGSASSWSRGPESSDDNRNTRRRLDTFSSPEDEHARSAVLLQFPCEQYHAGVSIWLVRIWATSNVPAFNRPIRLHCKTGSLSARFVFETRAKCHDFVARHTDDSISYDVHCPFCNTSTKIMVHQSKSLEDREIGRRFAPLWKVWSTKLQEIFPERGDKDSFIVTAFDVRSQILSILDRRNGVGKRVFKLAPPGHQENHWWIL